MYIRFSSLKISASELHGPWRYEGQHSWKEIIAWSWLKRYETRNRTTDNNNQGNANSWLSGGCVFTLAPLV